MADIERPLATQPENSTLTTTTNENEFDDLNKATQLTPIGYNLQDSETADLLQTLNKSKENKPSNQPFSPYKFQLDGQMESTPISITSTTNNNDVVHGNINHKFSFSTPNQALKVKSQASVPRSNATPGKSILKNPGAYKSITNLAAQPSQQPKEAPVFTFSKKYSKSPKHIIPNTPAKNNNNGSNSPTRSSVIKSGSPSKRISFAKKDEINDDSADTTTSSLDDDTQMEIERQLNSSRKRRSEALDLTNEKNEQQVIKRSHNAEGSGMTLHKILTDPAVPYVLSLYLQLFFNILILSVIAYFVYSFVRTIQADVENKIEMYASDVLQEISLCSREYLRNNCQPGLRVPALENSCMAWEKCMNRDPAAVGRARIGAETFAEIVNGFIKPISWKSIITILLITVGSLVFTNTAFGTYRSFSMGGNHSGDQGHHKEPQYHQQQQTITHTSTPSVHSSPQMKHQTIMYSPTRRRIGDSMNSVNNNTNNSGIYTTPKSQNQDHGESTAIYDTPDTDFHFSLHKLDNSELRLPPPANSAYASPLAGRNHQIVDRY